LTKASTRSRTPSARSISITPGRSSMPGRGRLVRVELGGAEGALELREVSVGECATGAYSAETLGLTMAEGKKTLAGLAGVTIATDTLAC